jgi:hypothetical protein
MLKQQEKARWQVVRYDDDPDDAVDDNDTFNDNDNIVFYAFIMFYVKVAGEGAVASRKV